MTNDEKMKLINDNLGLVNKAVNEYTKKRSINILGAAFDYEDLFQTGCIGLINAVGSYDHNKGSAFSTYATSCIIHALASEYKSSKISQSANDVEFESYKSNMTVSYDTPVCQDVNIDYFDSLRYEEDFAAKEISLYAENVIDEISKKKAKRGRPSTVLAYGKEIIPIICQGYNYKETAKILGIEQSTVKNVISKLRQMAKDSPECFDF